MSLADEFYSILMSVGYYGRLGGAPDALDIMADASYNGASGVVIHEHQLAPEFFDLKTRLAGEILQKFSNYRMQLAIVGDFTKYKSKSLNDFIFESNKTGHILFVDSLENALELMKKS